MTSTYDFDACDGLLIENEALVDELNSLRQAMTLILNEYASLRKRHERQCERTGKNRYDY